MCDILCVCIRYLYMLLEQSVDNLPFMADATHVLLTGKITSVDAAMAVGAWLKNARHVECLDLSWNILGVDWMQHILKGLSDNDTVVEINLRCVRLDDDSASLLGAWIGRSTRIRSLDLAGTNMSEEGIKSVGKGIGLNASIQVLMLCVTVINAAWTEHIFNGINVNQSVQQLTFTHCDLNDDAVASVSAGLKGNRSIRTLGLLGNDFSATGMNHVCDALSVNTSLIMIDIDGRHTSLVEFGRQICARNRAFCQQGIRNFNLYQTLMLSGKVAKLPKHVLVMISQLN